jgi:CRISPR-associated protein Csm5
MNFLHTTRLTLTPLSPIHIGTGEDFEPTNYVIENGVLYGFEPSHAHATLPPDLQDELNKLGLAANLGAIQRFFSKNSQHFKLHAHVFIPVSKGVAREYDATLGKVVNLDKEGRKLENKVYNNQFIARASYQAFNSESYIPGSSVKGAIRTAILDSINNKQVVSGSEKVDAKALESRLLQGDFENSSFRLIKIADFMPCGEVFRNVVFATAHKKSPFDAITGLENDTNGPPTRKEVIEHGQYRAFQADVSIHDLGEHATLLKKNSNLREIALQVNSYYYRQLKLELQMLMNRGFCKAEWRDRLQELLEGELLSKLKAGDAFLIRLGSNAGAESKTLRGSGVSAIEIKQKKKQPAIKASETTMIYLTSAISPKGHELPPFGWALIEINPMDDLPKLRNWCEIQSKVHKSTQEIKTKQQQAAIAQAEQAKLAEAAREQQQAHEAKLNAMSPTQRITQTLCEQLDATPVQKQPGGDIFKTVEKVLNDALTDSAWDAAAKLFLADSVAPLLKAKGMMVGKAEKEFKRLLRELRGL